MGAETERASPPQNPTSAVGPLSLWIRPRSKVGCFAPPKIMGWIRLWLARASGKCRLKYASVAHLLETRCMVGGPRQRTWNPGVGTTSRCMRSTAV